MTSSADTVPLCKRLHRGKRDREGRAWQSKGMGGDRREKREFSFKQEDLCFSVAKKTSSDIFLQLRLLLRLFCLWLNLTDRCVWLPGQGWYGGRRPKRIYSSPNVGWPATLFQQADGSLHGSSQLNQPFALYRQGHPPKH